ncbi:hypothetical protein H4W33_009788 [Kibdelosporangium phytohabitans]|nr:hypothetical protein [Kibdelosporangium phytohabitans]
MRLGSLITGVLAAATLVTRTASGSATAEGDQK